MPARVFILIILVLLLPACLPSRFVIDLAASDGQLLEREVLRDDAASTLKVAMIDVDGLISHAATGGLIAGRSNSVDNLSARLDKAEKDPAVRAVILRINSPGGTVAASESMYHEIVAFRARTKKPVVVSMAEVAASGGYFISLAADEIIAQPSTITGSIGVIIQTVNFSRGMEKIGIEARAVKSAPNKDLANPLEPIREEQYAVLQSTVNDFYSAFRDLVAERRGDIDPARFDTLTDGRIFTGRQALAEGLVDSTGGLRDAYAAAKRLAGISHAKLVKYHEDGRVPASPYASASSPTSPAGSEINLIQLNVPGGLAPAAGFYYLWSPGVP